MSYPMITLFKINCEEEADCSDTAFELYTENLTVTLSCSRISKMMHADICVIACME